MQEIEIYANYGVLAHEKKVVYSYGAENPYATVSEVFRIQIPEEWKISESVSGKKFVSAPWGEDYEINEILSADKNENPVFRAWDKERNYVVTPLEVLEEGN